MKKIKCQAWMLAVLCFLYGAASLFAADHHPIGGPLGSSNSHAAKNNPVPGYDSVLVRKFTAAIRSLDFNRTTCTYSGTVNLNDPNDPANTPQHIPFLFCRLKGDYYYRVAGTEIIHSDHMNISILHNQRKVVISSQQMAIHPLTQGTDSIMKRLAFENYQLKSRVKGTSQIISIVNEKHITCKELSVTLDAASGKLERIYSRFTDFGSPMDKGLDRVMDVKINILSKSADRKLYPSAADVVRMHHGKWQLTGKYATYELIML